MDSCIECFVCCWDGQRFNEAELFRCGGSFCLYQDVVNTSVSSVSPENVKSNLQAQDCKQLVHTASFECFRCCLWKRTSLSRDVPLAKEEFAFEPLTEQITRFVSAIKAVLVIARVSIAAYLMLLK